MRSKSSTSDTPSERLVRDIRRATRKQYSAEEKIRIVLDVSGDGIDNCAEPFEAARERDELVAMGVTINGLPIMVKGENDVVGSGAYRAPGFALKGLLIGPGTHQTTMEEWYAANVIGGPSGFLIKANGFEDFGHAFRQKFVSEISSAEIRVVPR